MKPAVKAQYTPDVRAAVAAAVGGTPEQLRDLGGFESFVHEIHRDGRDQIVKATWGARRTPEEMGAELHFVNYLAEAGAPVCRPLPLASGAMQESVQSADGVFHVTAWAKAVGEVLPKESFSPEVFRRWGALVGQFHRLSASYAGPPAPCARPTWQDEHASLAALVESEPEMHAKFHEHLAAIAALPRCANSYGTMHTDLHRWNIHWHAGEPAVFDFEDMIDFWFVSDLAIVLFYAVMSPLEGQDRQALYDELQGPLWEGYATQHALPAEARETLPMFLTLREHTLRAVVLRSIPESERSPGWIEFISEAEERILSGKPALGLRL